MNLFPSVSGLELRAAGTDDVAVLAAFNCALALESEGLVLAPDVVQAGVSRLIATPLLGGYRLAVVGEKVVASLLITSEWSDWHNRYYWWLQSVYVLPEYRRQGIFSALYQAVLAEAQASGEVASLRLYVERQNLSAQRTYQQLGMMPSHYQMFEQSLLP
jgi:ribosomal protein S18 acetylase RimI-like enzyme